MGQIRRFLARYEVAVGLVVTLACSLGGQWLVTLPGLSLVGALVLALLLGMALQGVTSLRDAARQSTPFIANKFLRAGIILLGFKLNLILLMGAGMKSLLAAIVVVTVMVTLNYVVARRLFGVEHTLAVLTACGSSICGAAAVMGVAGAAKAKADDSVLAVACVAILGTAFTLVLVALQPVLGFSAAQFGTLAGLSLHEIAHAVAAGGAAGAVGTDAAIVAKLSRVLLLAPVAVLVGVLEARRAVVAKRQAALAGVGNVEVEISPATEAASQGWWAQLKHVPIPWFMGGFLLASAVGTYVPFVAEFTGGLVTLAYILLGMAMAALGLNVNFSVVAHKGARPLTSACLCSVFLVGLAYTIVRVFF